MCGEELIISVDGMLFLTGILISVVLAVMIFKQPNVSIVDLVKANQGK